MGGREGGWEGEREGVVERENREIRDSLGCSGHGSKSLVQVVAVEPDVELARSLSESAAAGRSPTSPSLLRRMHAHARTHARTQARTRIHARALTLEGAFLSNAR